MAATRPLRSPSESLRNGVPSRRVRGSAGAHEQDLVQILSVGEVAYEHGEQP